MTLHTQYENEGEGKSLLGYGEEEAYDPPGTRLGTVLNIMKNGVGGGILALPFAFTGTGVTGGSLSTVMFALMALVAVFCIAKSIDVVVQKLEQSADAKGKEPDCAIFTYRHLTTECFGPQVGVVCDIILILYTVGTQIAYIVFLQEFFQKVFDAWFGAGSLPSNRLFICAGAFIILSILCSLRDLEALKFTSMAGLSFLVYAVIAVIYEFFKTHHATPDPTCDYDFIFSTRSLEAFPIICFAYGVHYNIPRYYRELPRRSAGKMTMLGFIAFFNCTVFYGVMAVFGYLSWGQQTNSNIVNNYSESNVIITIARLGLSGEILCTFPIVHNATRQALSPLIFDRERQEGEGSVLDLPGTHLCGFVTFVPLKMYLMSLAVIVFEFVVGYIAAKNVGIVIAYNSAIFGSAIYFVLPGIFFVKICSGRPGVPGWQTGCAWFILIGGILNTILGVTGTIFQQVDS